MENNKLDKLLDELKYWMDYEPVNNMGKWSTQTRIDSLKKQIDNLKKGIEDDKNTNLTIEDLLN